MRTSPVSLLPADSRTPEQPENASGPPRLPEASATRIPANCRGSSHPLQHQPPTAEQRRLAGYLNMTLDQLDARLPTLRWVRLELEQAYAVLDENGDRLPLTISEATSTVTEVAATLDDHTQAPEDRVKEAVAARELHRLMTDYAPRRVAELLIAGAKPVQIGSEVFHLPVVRLADRQEAALFSDGSQLKLGQQTSSGVYQPAGTVDAPVPATDTVPVDPWQVPGEQQEEADAGYTDDGDLEPLHEDFGPLFGLHPDDQLVQELGGQPGPQIGQEQPRSVREGKRPASSEGEPPSGRRRLDSASDRWAASKKTIIDVWLPDYGALPNQQRLRLQAAASSVPPRGSALADAQARLQAHRDEQFRRVAKSVAEVTKCPNIFIAPLKQRISNLGEGPHREFMQELLNQACETFPGAKPDTIRDGTAIRRINACLRFLDALKKKAGEKNTSIEECLEAILKKPLAHLPEKQRTAPDADTSKRCVEELRKELGEKNLNAHCRRDPKELIKILTGVDLRFHNAGNAAAAAPSSDNPIPKTGKGTILHGRFESLTVKANREAFAGFFIIRNSIEKAKDREGMNSYAYQVSQAMQFLTGLEKEKDVDGKPREVETELKKAFGRALEPEKQPVADWKKWRTVKLTRAQQDDVRRELKTLPGIDRINLSRHYPFFYHITGIWLGPGNPEASASR